MTYEKPTLTPLGSLKTMDPTSPNMPANLDDDEIELAVQQTAELTRLQLRHRREQGALLEQHQLAYAELKAAKKRAEQKGGK